ncbi:methyl-accepting chemotaxis protein [Sporomusa sphaeroides DSM 2875]|uniref:HAMP domain-containing protein n=1 Tax=Sporomusa sphaeroides TaxID=47679 RepID=UPI00202DC694|nr:methyl-accepting chemotaxis protein [Sporomusa sphaeroides]MCM0759497.1 methyl-accepting chemotaxis protein [Sporomusa sphaeroides DSM 2875]
MTFLILLLSVISYYSANGIRNQVLELQRATTRLTLSLQVANEFTGAVGEARGFVAYGNEKMLDNYNAKLAKALALVKQILAVTDEGKQLVVEQLISDTIGYTKGVTSEFIPLLREQMLEQKAGNREKAQMLQVQSGEIAKKYVPLAEGIMKGSHALVEENTQIATDRLEVIREIIQQIIMISVSLGILATLIASTLTITIPAYIKKSLIAILDATKRYAAGDLSLPVTVEKQDEFGEIGSAINEMVRGISTLVVKISQASAGLAAASQQLTASAEQSAHAVSQVAESIIMSPRVRKNNWMKWAQLIR